MGRKLWVRTDDGTTLKAVLFAYQDTLIEMPDDSLVAASTLSACTPASHLFSGVDPDGDVVVTAFYGGAPENALQVALATGPIGAGNEDLLLRVDAQGEMPSQQVTVLFATDGVGASITPTAVDVAALLNTDPLASQIVTATAGGTGLADVVAAVLTNLSGGLDDGDRVLIHGMGPGGIPADFYVHRAEVL